MGFDLTIMQMMIDLKAAQVLGKGKVIEFGHSDIFATRAAVEALFEVNNRVNNLELDVDNLFVGQNKKQDCAEQFYAHLGFDEYASIDLYDERAKFNLDLNNVYQEDVYEEKYDLLCNLGTSEHVFNPGNSFINAHNFVKRGGLMTHFLPTFGHINHGYYNIHPMLLLDLAKVNNYEVEQIIYLDCHQKRSIDYTEYLMNGGNDIAMFKGDPSFVYTGKENLEVEREDRPIILGKFCSSIINILNGDYEGKFPVYMATNMIFCVFRKINDDPFITPGQS